MVLVVKLLAFLWVNYCLLSTLLSIVPIIVNYHLIAPLIVHIANN